MTKTWYEQQTDQSDSLLMQRTVRSYTQQCDWFPNLPEVGSSANLPEVCWSANLVSIMVRSRLASVTSRMSSCCTISFFFILGTRLLFAWHPYHAYDQIFQEKFSCVRICMLIFHYLKTGQDFEHFNPLKSSPGSHSQSVSDSVST